LGEDGEDFIRGLMLGDITNKTNNMGAHSTLRFTREKALEYVKFKLDEPHFPNEELERIMDILLDKQLYNCVISDFPDEDELRYLYQ
jgi:hypothetical protein